MFKSHPLVQRVVEGMIPGRWAPWNDSVAQAALLPFPTDLGTCCCCRCRWVSPAGATPLPLGPLWGAEVGHRSALDSANQTQPWLSVELFTLGGNYGNICLKQPRKIRSHQRGKWWLNSQGSGYGKHGWLRAKQSRFWQIHFLNILIFMLIINMNRFI